MVCVVVGGLLVASLVLAVPGALGSRPVVLLDLPGVDDTGWAGAAVGAKSVARLLSSLAALVSVVGIAVAGRKAAGDSRRAFSTVLVGAAAVVIAFLGGSLVAPLTGQRHGVPTELYSFATLCLPAAIAVAIARFRVYEVRTALSRSALVAGVGAALAVVYLAVLGLGAALLDHARVLSVPGALAAGAVVLATVPLVELGRQIPRRWFGRELRAVAIADRLSSHLRDDTTDTPTQVLAASVRDALRLGSVELVVDGMAPCTVGDPDPPCTAVPLVYAGHTLGALVVSARPGEALARRDRELLDETARYVAVAAEAVRTSDDLRRAQHALESAHAEERRRVRRDLHDSVAPTLASVRLKLTALRRTTGSDALDDLVEQVADTIREVRRIVDGLQPSVLEDLGLLPALQILVADTRQAANIAVVLDAPDALPELPADAANTAYRVVSEALANVMRHSDASRCTVRVDHDAGVLEVEVRDDGRGFELGGSRGMGLRSIATRATMANGTAAVDTSPGAGTTITLRVPA